MTWIIEFINKYWTSWFQLYKNTFSLYKSWFEINENENWVVYDVLCFHAWISLYNCCRFVSWQKLVIGNIVENSSKYSEKAMRYSPLYRLFHVIISWLSLNFIVKIQTELSKNLYFRHGHFYFDTYIFSRYFVLLILLCPK